MDDYMKAEREGSNKARGWEKRGPEGAVQSASRKEELKDYYYSVNAPDIG